MSSVAVIARGTAHIIDRKYIDYSSYLSSHLSFLEGSGNLHYTDESIVIDMEDEDPRLVSNYLSFLKGDQFSMTRTDAIFFDKMGHSNSLNYPLDYWRLKLRSKWTRDNFYKYRLKDRDDGLYNLVEVPQKRTIISLSDVIDRAIPYDEIPSTITIAGGAALYLSGHAEHFSDIDLFPMSKKDGIGFINTLQLSSVTVATVGDTVDVTYRDYDTNISYYNLKIIQLIKREFSCPSEIVHSFDIDACGFILVNRDGTPRLYATELALYSTANKAIWYDPEFSEERYYWRLLKYIGRGYKLYVPFLDEKNVDYEYILSLIHKYSNQPITADMGSIGEETYNHQLWRVLKLIYMNIPTDIGTLIILMSIFKIHVSSTHGSYNMSYVKRVLDDPITPISVDHYLPEDRNTTIYDWVVRDKVVLREPYQSKLNIDGAIELRDILLQSPLYVSE